MMDVKFDQITKSSVGEMEFILENGIFALFFKKNPKICFFQGIVDPSKNSNCEKNNKKSSQKTSTPKKVSSKKEKKSSHIAPRRKKSKK